MGLIKEIKTESYNLVHALLKFFPNSLLFIFTSLPFMLLRELARIMVRCLKLRHELFYLKNFPRWIKLPFFLPDGKLMIWEMRDFRYLFTVREIYIDDFYGLRNSRRKLNVIIDAGAHVGFFTMYGLNFIDVEGKIIALEPSPGNFSRLIRHLNLNSTKIKGSVLPLSYALSDKDGEVFLEITEDTETSHITKFPKKAVKCKSITLASLIKTFGLPQVDILKLDVEGAEHFILREERTRTILRNGFVSEIRAELHGHLNDRLDLINYLRSLGYIIKHKEHGDVTTKIHAIMITDKTALEDIDESDLKVSI